MDKWQNKMRNSIKKPSDLIGDLAGTHKIEAPAANRNSPEIDADYAVLMRDGYVIIEKLLQAEQIDLISSEVTKLLGKKGRNNFEGLLTQRVYGVLSKTTCIDRLVDHPRILGLVDRVHQQNFLLSQAQIINILPDEEAQMLHIDDGFYKIARPRAAVGCASIWAIDDFTESNGATAVIPGSHTWGEKEFGSPEQCIPAVMPAGSVIFFLGTTIHGGGANKSHGARLAVTCQYCEPYLRQQENFTLSVAKDRVREMSPELISMLGYSIAPPFMGMVNGVHPKRLLEESC
ncbi:MAG: ectoine hydroxylase-related dioxygenase (phytanoyl-CoA dioxygenase family) [Cryomorphaceae bacterium]|jgi:ectoine hydroxylase-related dioxygenase (phytanoyl-CoA dioxygenase family)